MTRPAKLFQEPSELEADSTSHDAQPTGSKNSNYKGSLEKGSIPVDDVVPVEQLKEEPTSKSDASTAQFSLYLLATVASLAALII